MAGCCFKNSNCKGGTPPPQQWGRGLSCTGVTGDHTLLLNMAAGRGTKANMANTGIHWLEGWTLPLAFGMLGILGEDF